MSINKVLCSNNKFIRKIINILTKVNCAQNKYINATFSLVIVFIACLLHYELGLYANGCNCSANNISLKAQFSVPCAHVICFTTTSFFPSFFICSLTFSCIQYQFEKLNLSFYLSDFDDKNIDTSYICSH